MAQKIKETIVEKHAYKTRYAPTLEPDIEYPESDGKPMGETELHRDALMQAIQTLIEHFKDEPDVCVSGNMMMYYIKGDPKKSISPDVFVAFGVGKKSRRIFRICDEGKPPDFVLEFSSQKTYPDDIRIKIPLYAEIGIREYFLCDLEGINLPSPLIGYRLVDGEYIAIPVDANGHVISETLGLELCLRNENMGFYDPAAKKWLQTPVEAATVWAEKEYIARQRIEQENLQLREEIERLKLLTKST